jgi:hypothetical protein
LQIPQVFLERTVRLTISFILNKNCLPFFEAQKLRFSDWKIGLRGMNAVVRKACKKFHFWINHRPSLALLHLFSQRHYPQSQEISLSILQLRARPIFSRANLTCHRSITVNSQKWLSEKSETFR